MDIKLQYANTSSICVHHSHTRCTQSAFNPRAFTACALKLGVSMRVCTQVAGSKKAYTIAFDETLYGVDATALAVHAHG